MSIRGLGLNLGSVALSLSILAVLAPKFIGWQAGLAQSQQELHDSCHRPVKQETQATSIGRSPGSKDVRRSLPSGQTTNVQAKRYLLQDQCGREVRPMALVCVDEEVYFLGPQCVWLAKGVKDLQTQAQRVQESILVLARFDPPLLLKAHVCSQEFNDFIPSPLGHALIILDKSGDIFSFNLVDKIWSIVRANAPSNGAPDPDYVALCSLPKGIALLDPERNQIWRAEAPFQRLLPCLREVLPWRVKPGQIFLADTVAIARGLDNDLCLLKKDGHIVRFGGVTQGRIYQKTFHYYKPDNMRPSRLCSDDVILYVIERENNRVLKIDQLATETKQFIFENNCDLRGLVPSGDGFWIISGNEILYRSSKESDPWGKKINAHPIDSRLKGLILPIAGQRLPAHPGVYPGSRRLYRFGVHEGLDMFNDPGSKVHVLIGTSVRAAQDGKVIRVDTDFKDMDLRRFNQVMNECRREHRTSAASEDLFRGCQVWIDHGHGLVTRYAHLSKANPLLKVNMDVKQGDLIGYVGISGTGENLPGHIPYPHLHFEIWLDGKYVGYGLTPTEIVGVYQDIFQSGGVGAKLDRHSG